MAELHDQDVPLGEAAGRLASVKPTGLMPPVNVVLLNIFCSPMQPAIRREGNREFRIGTCFGRPRPQGPLADIDHHRLVGADQPAGPGPASRVDRDRSSCDGRIAARSATTSAATVALGGSISDTVWRTESESWAVGRPTFAMRRANLTGPPQPDIPTESGKRRGSGVRHAGKPASTGAEHPPLSSMPSMRSGRDGLARMPDRSESNVVKNATEGRRRY